MAQAHEPRDRGQGGRRGEDALADQRVLAHQPPLDVVERARLVQDVVGHGDLADVVQLRGAGEHVELLGVEPELAPGPRRQLGDVGHVAPQFRLALGQHLHQHVARLPAAGRAARVLVRVHALVGQLQRRLRARGLGGDLDDPVGGADVEALAVLAERLDRARDDRVEAAELAVEQETELVPAEAVGGAAALDRAGQRAAEPREQRVAGAVAERVVVGLEAVEIEEQQRADVLVGVAQRILEVVHQAAPVGQATEPVGERLVVAAPQQAEVLAERQTAARHRGEQPGGGEDAGERRQVGDPAVEQQPEREHGEAGGDEHRHPVACSSARDETAARPPRPWRARSPARRCRPGRPRCTCPCSRCSCRSRRRSRSDRGSARSAPMRVRGASP